MSNMICFGQNTTTMYQRLVIYNIIIIYISISSINYLLKVIHLCRNENTCTLNVIHTRVFEGTKYYITESETHRLLYLSHHVSSVAKFFEILRHDLLLEWQTIRLCTKYHSMLKT